MDFKLEYRNDDYRFFGDSVEADTLEEAIEKARVRLSEHKCCDCTVLADVAFIGSADSDVLIDAKQIERLYTEVCKQHGE